MTIFRSVEPNYKSSDSVTAQEKKELRRRIGKSMISQWLAIATSASGECEDNQKPDAKILRQPSKLTKIDNYKDIAQNLCSMLDYVDLHTVYEKIDFLCNSSAKDCRIYTGTEIGTKLRVVIKKTKLCNKFRVMDVENELRIMNMCDHRHIVKTERAIGHEGSVWLCSKFHRYGSLMQMIHCWSPLNESEVAYIMRQLLSAVDYLHSLHIMHLDIKSDNVLVDDNLHMKLTDFGAAVLCPSNKFNEVRGTPYWMSPEVIRSEMFRLEYTNKTDIWSLGILMWELMFKGEPPRFDLDPLDAMSSIIESPAPKLPQPELWTSELNDFMCCMLAKDPNLRWSAAQLLHHPFIELYKDFDAFEPKIVI
jgi:serine/threonine protein kinase